LFAVVDNWNYSVYQRVAKSNGQEGAGGGAPLTPWAPPLTNWVAIAIGGLYFTVGAPDGPAFAITLQPPAQVYGFDDTQAFTFTADGHIESKLHPGIVLDVEDDVNTDAPVIGYPQWVPAQSNQLWTLNSDGTIVSHNGAALYLTSAIYNGILVAAVEVNSPTQIDIIKDYLPPINQTNSTESYTILDNGDVSPGWAIGTTAHCTVSISYNESYTGNQSLQMTSTAANQYIHLTNSAGISTSGYNYLSLAVKSQEGADKYYLSEPLRVGVNNVAGWLLVASYGGGFPTSDFWRTYYIPLSSLQIENSVLNTVWIAMRPDTGIPASPTFYIDDVQLVAQSPFPYY